MDFIAKNIMFVFSVLVLVGTWLIMFGSLRSELKAMRDVQDDHKERHKANEERWTEHLKDETPHKPCLAELQSKAGMSKSIDDLRDAVSRVESWVMALANKQGIKRPEGNGD